MEHRLNEAHPRHYTNVLTTSIKDTIANRSTEVALNTLMVSLEDAVRSGAVEELVDGRFRFVETSAPNFSLEDALNAGFVEELGNGLFQLTQNLAVLRRMEHARQSFSQPFTIEGYSQQHIQQR